jgi:hypothetical protein
MPPTGFVSDPRTSEAPHCSSAADWVVGCRLSLLAPVDPPASTYARGMVRSWDLEGEIAMTEHWRSVVPDLAIDLARDQTDIANDRRRVERVRRRYALELKHVGGRKHSGMSSLTRISDW